ncbi:MAG: helix-turn-helix domain-containing protein [Thermoplasmatota archaeon]
MELGDLTRRMAAFGLEEAEAELYYHLCRLGGGRAAAISEAAGHQRSESYRILDRLVEKGFAQRSMERPARYSACPPEEALRRAVESRRSEAEVLARSSAELAALWPRPLQAEPESKHRYAVHQGEAQIAGLLGRMLASAKEEILFATSASGLAHLQAAQVQAALLERAREGVVVRMLVKRRDGDAPLFPAIAGVSVRYADLPAFYQAVLVDAREIAFLIHSERGSAGATGLWLNASELVLAQKAYFDAAWNSALAPSDLDAGGAQQVQLIRGRWLRNARLKKIIAGARTSVVIQAPAEEVRSWPSQGLSDLLARRAQAGLLVVVYSPAGTPVVPGATMVSSPVSRALVALVDGSEALMALDASQDPGGSQREHEWALWSTHPGFLELLHPSPPAGAAEAARHALAS